MSTQIRGKVGSGDRGIGGSRGGSSGAHQRRQIPWHRTPNRRERRWSRVSGCQWAALHWHTASRSPSRPVTLIKEGVSFREEDGEEKGEGGAGSCRGGTRQDRRRTRRRETVSAAVVSRWGAQWPSSAGVGHEEEVGDWPQFGLAGCLLIKLLGFEMGLGV